MALVARHLVWSSPGASGTKSRSAIFDFLNSRKARAAGSDDALGRVAGIFAKNSIVAS